MTPTRELKSPEEMIAILGDPRRMRILEILVREQASVKQLAEMIQESPQTTHYHTKQLEKTGLIEIVAKQEVRGAVEKFYRATADRFLVTGQAIGEGSGNPMATWSGVVAEWTQLSDYFLETVDAGDFAMTGTFQVVGSDKPTMEEFAKTLAQATSDFPKCERPSGGQKYALVIGLFPVPPDMAVPEAPNELLGLSEDLAGKGAEMEMG
jgi:DNA-binding transcriptional ArsR family regulator